RVRPVSLHDALPILRLDLAERTVRKAAPRVEPVVERAVHLIAVEPALADPASLEVRVRHVLEPGRLAPPGRIPLAPHEPLPLFAGGAPPAPVPAWKRCKRRAAGAGAAPCGYAGSVMTATDCAVAG